MDIHTLQQELSKQLAGEVYSDLPTRHLFSTDASIYQVLPLAIVYPRDDVDVRKVVRYAYDNNIQIHGRGAGSAIGGQSLGPGIMVDFVKYRHKIHQIERDPGTVWTDPGVRYADLNRAVKPYGLFFPPDPSSGNYCTVGGMTANNTSGAHSVKYGITGEYIQELEAVLANGEQIHARPYEVESEAFQRILSRDTMEASIYRQIMAIIDEARPVINESYPDIRYNVSGYNLRGVYEDGVINLVPLFVGSEGTLGLIVRIKIGLLPIPRHNVLAMAMFKDISSSGEATIAAVERGAAAVELMDNSLVKKAREVDEELDQSLPKELDNVLMIEFDGDDLQECTAALEDVRRTICEDNHWAFEFTSATTPAEQDRLWGIRKAAVPLANKIKGDAKAIGFVEDAAVPLKHLVEYYREVYACSSRHDVQFNVYGHAGKGLLHVRPVLSMKSPEDIEKFKKISQELFEVVERLNGTPCGEHGDGRVRSKYIQCLYPDLFPWFLRVKEAFDPKGLFNPDVKTNTSTTADTENLRYGSDYQVVVDTSRTVLHWGQNNSEFQEQIEMCHGCSTCTTVSKAVNMCPVYKVTRDEKSAPKAKANILRHIIQGHLDPKTYPYSKEFKTILDQCISCQSCHLECVSNVNIPKLMLEAKARYTLQNGQTFQNRVVTQVERMARLNCTISPVVNPLMQSSLVRKVMEKTVGLASQRKPVTFSRQTTVDHASKLARIKSPTRKVAYFTGCAANYMQTDVAKAAIDVLTHNNIQVEVPEQHCCGLPKLSNGHIKEARYDVISNAGLFSHYIKKGYDVITTCTSCALSLKEEWQCTVDNDDTRFVARNTYSFSEYLLGLHQQGELRTDFQYTMPERVRRYAYHTPCHLKVQSGGQSTMKLLELIPGLSVEGIKAGCCGMSGSWGMKKQNYQLSLAIGEDLGRIMSQEETDGITDCPTCRLQIQHLAKDKDGHHPAVILAQAYGLPRSGEE
ncbi:anaerobic glycerol-3-phosphate dehydrogenase subunit C [Desulfurispira natronophila]|uniref:FAD/FMN-containing dehydrogenase/Fe-S oxidoreductase n=1 Tax=Desulfurispira natronophila TaxID=682562 RepID=A0A7W7Y4E8_9BACT|nr:anaerobic glycerol-3-phosphate dehydrogenase subunit C [Desulfurispira natronophila]MBB5021898.1 FAD/FMN-containing dehydrogenase/Fe-S oxidoreductase [Desulfurispira natronophila]